jgi:hypothetical protein
MRSNAQFSHNNRILKAILGIILLSAVLLSACGTTQTTTPAAASPTVGIRATHTPSNTDSPTLAATPTSTAVAASTITPPSSLTPTPTPAPTNAVSPTPTILFNPVSLSVNPTQTEPPFWLYMAADIQNNVDGVMQVLNVTGDNGKAIILLRTTYISERGQFNPSYNVIKYLSTYFKGISNQALARLFGGKQFSIELHTTSLKDEFFIESTTPYDLLVQVDQNQMKQGEWEAQAHAYMTIQYKVIALCSVRPETVLENTDTPLTIDAWLLYRSMPVKMQYVTAEWKDSTGHQYYCAGDAYDSSCRGHSGNVTAHDVITVNVGIQAADGLYYTCQTSYTTP